MRISRSRRRWGSKRNRPLPLPDTYLWSNRLMDRAYSWSLAFFIFLGLLSSLRSDDQDRLQVGVQPDGRIVVPTNQILNPAGQQITFPGRPVDLTLTDNGKTLVVKKQR